MSSVPISSAFVRRQINPAKPGTKTETTIGRENENKQAIVKQGQPFYNLFFTSYEDLERNRKRTKT